ncbi:MAG: hypothetical protein Q7J29_06025 [Stagnimonas sp.]|nr:hypothetical protein [Stagnimonas sp.]
MKDTFLVFVAVASYSRNLGKLIRCDASAVATYGLERENHLIGATRMFSSSLEAQGYAAQLQQKLDVQLNAEVDAGEQVDFSRYEALFAIVQPHLG